MTLEEAIERENSLAYSYGERYKRLGEPVGDLQELEAEHRQMAEWLRELKAYREILANASKIIESQYGCVIIEGYADVVDQMIEIYMEELNADEDSD